MRIHLPVALGGAAALVGAVLALIPGASAHAATTATASSTGTAAFTACVRAHGVADFPGVTVTSDGRVLIDLSASGTGFDPLSAAYRAAVEACAAKLPAGDSLPVAPKLSRPSVPEITLDGTSAGLQIKAPEAPAEPN